LLKKSYKEGQKRQKDKEEEEEEEEVSKYWMTIKKRVCWKIEDETPDRSLFETLCERCYGSFVRIIT
jgi:hypothetical protein